MFYRARPEKFASQKSDRDEMNAWITVSSLLEDEKEYKDFFFSNFSKLNKTWLDNMTDMLIEMEMVSAGVSSTGWRWSQVKPSQIYCADP